MSSCSKKKKRLVSLFILVLAIVVGQVFIFLKFSSSLPEQNNFSLEHRHDSDTVAKSRSIAIVEQDESFPIASQVHCVGDNFMANAWLYRSCQYRYLCWSERVQNWLLFPSKLDQQLQQNWTKRFGWQNGSAMTLISSSVARMSTSFQQDRILVSTIGMRPWWRRQQETFLWHPHIMLTSSTEHDFSTHHVKFFPINHVVIPISVVERKSSGSIMSLLMDTFYPIFILIEMFGFHDKNHVLLHVLNAGNLNEHASHASSDNCSVDCWSRFVQGTRWMGYEIWSPPPPPLPVSNQSTSNTICAPFAASGIGKLTANGLSFQGHNRQDYKLSNNVGRGGLFWKFRNHILSNIVVRTTNQAQNAVKVVVAVASDTVDIAAALVRRTADSPFPNIIVESSDASTREYEKLIQTAASSHFWIADASDEKMTWPAFFMPKAASLILLYDETDQLLEKKKKTTKNKNTTGSFGPVRHDFDIWNHMSHLKTHWLSIQHDAETLADIVVALINDDVSSEESHVLEIQGNEEGVGGYDAFAVDKNSLTSSIHCLGQTWQWDSMNHRSCMYKYLCLDLTTQQYLQLQPPDRRLSSLLTSHDSLSSDSFGKEVVRGENIRVGNGKPWLPNQVRANQTESIFFLLRDEVVMIPMKADQNNMKNPGHLLWDFWLPIYNLLQLFGHEHKQLLLVFDLQDSKCRNTTTSHTLTSSCLGDMVHKFLPLIGVKPSTTLFTNPDTHAERVLEGSKGKTLCARTGLAGVGMLTDHGFKTHGQQLDDYKIVWNVGRGPFFWDFRSFVLDKMNIGTSKLQPNKVVFSVNSSNNLERRKNFSKQINMVQHRFPDAQLESVEVGRMTTAEQLETITVTQILVSVIGGSVSSAMFLPRNTCLILFYNDIDDFVSGTQRMPTLMDFDFWNNASYLIVHWLPISTMDSEEDIRLLGDIIDGHLQNY